MDKLKIFMDGLVEEGVFPGYELGLIKEDMKTTIYGGYSQIYPWVSPMEPGLLFDLASLSKVVASLSACLLLIEEGKLDLYGCVRDYLPNFKEKDVRIVELLTHTSGLRADLNWRGRTGPELLDALMNSKVDSDLAGRKIVYSDLGYLLLGLVVDRITGSMDTYLQENFFKTLGMYSTGYNPHDKKNCVPTELTQWRGLVQGEVHDEKAYLLGGKTGHAGLFSSMMDLLNYSSMLLNEGLFNGRRILSSELIELIKRPRVSFLGETRSLGWLISTKEDNYCRNLPLGSIFHSGFTGPSIIMSFEERKACILLTNRVHPSRANNKLGEIRRTIHERVFEEL